MDARDPLHPDRYNPDRFMFAHNAPGAQLPFGTGLRMCAGISLAQSEVRP